MNNKSTTKIGDSLRDKVYSLCVAAGKNKVEKEYPIGGKKVDVYFEDVQGFDGLKRFGVECKNYSKALGEKEFTEIYAGYGSRKNHFDRLLVVSVNGVTENFRAGVASNNSWLSHFTWQEFLYQLINFKHYFKSLSYLVTNDDLSKYYVCPLNDNGEDIESLVVNWLAGNSNQPLAFLAGYGMGKSSFAKYICSKYATLFEENKFDRIPIYIKLGGLFNQQDIKSLITSYFAAEHQISDMTPSIFKEMNKMGLLLIVFDGFDEMKHGMTHEDFNSVFNQIKSLCVGKSRVIVLGRPSALTSEDDRNVLFGRPENSCNKLKTPVQNSVVFKEIKIAEHNDQQLNLLVPSYLEVLNQRIIDQGRSGLSKQKIKDRAHEILSPLFLDLIRRPVHADMLCTIAMYNPDTKLDQTSTYELYESFISLIIEREISKSARKAIGKSKRELFLESVAWEFWPEKGLNGFSITQLEASKVLLPNKDKPTDDIHREMLVGSLLEQKDGQLYYFAHRSFQEFLVAQRIIHLDGFDSNITKINKDLTTDIMRFIKESDNAIIVAKKVFFALDKLNEPISGQLLDIFFSNSCEKLLEEIGRIDVNTLNTKQCFVFSLLNYRTGKSRLRVDKIQDPLGRASAILAMVFGEDRKKEINSEVLGYILVFAKSILDKMLFIKHRTSSQIVLETATEVIWAKILISLDVSFDAKREFESLTIDGLETRFILNENLKIHDILDSYLTDSSLTVRNLDPIIRDAFNKVYAVTNTDDQGYVEYRRSLIQFLRSKPTDSSFVIDKTAQFSTIAKVPKRSTLKLKQS